MKNVNLLKKTAKFHKQKQPLAAKVANFVEMCFVLSLGRIN
jgi:hypothetical protein